MSLVPPKIVGPPVDWENCLSCGRKMDASEDRYRIELDGRIGIGHRQYQAGLVHRGITSKARRRGRLS